MRKIKNVLHIINIIYYLSLRINALTKATDFDHTKL